MFLYPDPTAKETVIIELVNGSKFRLKAFLSEIEKWLEVPELPVNVASNWR